MVSRQCGVSADGSRVDAKTVSVTWVALLRGINVGRASGLDAGSVTMLESMGYADVRTLGQSGNAIFASSQRKPEPLEREISAHIRSEFGSM